MQPQQGTKGTKSWLTRVSASVAFPLTVFALLFAVGCKTIVDRQDVRPKILRDVPARNLAYRLTPDVSPPSADVDDTSDKFPAIANEFAGKRKDDALLRTVVSPDRRRVLALYGAADDPGSTFRIDLYNSDGQFLRNVIPPDLACVFPDTVSWSPDGTFINFIAHRREMPSPTPTPDVPEPGPSPSPAATPSVAPIFAPVVSFNTEQIYIANRDGYDLKPLTSREGLIYFYFAWAPDGHALAALACKEDEWNARERQGKLPAGRPRLITPSGNERLLDDALTEALPVWSPDASKIATAFDSDVAIYDAGGKTPTQARLPLGEQLLAASVAYDQKTTTKKANNNSNSGTHTVSSTPSVPASFNPIVRLDWRSPDTLYFQTAYVRLMSNETINTFQRWHLLNISAQAAILK
jgi:Tol biopolymer transport system component